MKCVLATSCLLILAGCSDDTTPADSGPKPDVTVDRGADAPADLSLDAPLEVGADAVADASAEATVVADGPGDLTPKDGSGPDVASPDMGTPNLSGTITRTVQPILDAKGDLHIGLSVFPPPALIQFAGVTIKGVHLPSTSSTYSYTMNAPAGTYWLFAFLDDNNNYIAFPPTGPDVVDLATSNAPQIKVVAGQPLTEDLVLDTLGGYVATDGGVAPITGIKGVVKASVAPALDGKGKLFAALFNQPPSQGGAAVAQSANNSVDLSSPFTQEMYFIGNLQPGQYYLRVFVDDNGSTPLGKAPDKGDLVHSSDVQVHVVSGTITSQDVVLDKVQP